MPACALNWHTRAGLAKARSRTGEPAGAALLTHGLGRSKARPSAWPCLRSSINGSSKQLRIGARSSEPSGKCNGSAGRNSLPPYPIPVVASDWGKKCSGWCRCRDLKLGIPKLTAPATHPRLAQFKREQTAENQGDAATKPWKNSAKMSEIIR